MEASFLASACTLERVAMWRNLPELFAKRALRTATVACAPSKVKAHVANRDFRREVKDAPTAESALNPTRKRKSSADYGGFGENTRPRACD